MTRRKIDRAMVELAIAEIEANGKPVTVKELAGITGYSSGGLQNQDYLKKYIKAYKPKAPAPSPIKQIVIDHSVQSYCQHIFNHYFASDEARGEVKVEMMAEVEGFKPSLYEQAVNRLLVERYLLTNKLNGKLFVNQDKELEDQQEAEKIENLRKIEEFQNRYGNPQGRASEPNSIEEDDDFSPFISIEEEEEFLKESLNRIKTMSTELSIKKPAIRELHLKLDDGAEIHITSGEVTQELVQEILKTIFNRVS